MGDKDAPRTPRGTLTTVRARAGYQIHQDPAGSAKHPRFIPHATVRAIATEEHQTSWDWTDLPGVIVHKITKSVWLKRKPFQQSPTRNKWYCSKEPWWPIFIQMTFCPFMLKWNVCVHLRMYLYIFLPWPSIWSVQAAAQTSDPSMNPGNNFVLMLGLWSVGRLSSTILFALNMMSSLCCYDQCLQTEHCDRLGNLVIQSHLHCFRYVTHLCFNRSWDQSQTTEFRLWSAPGFYVSEYQCSIQVSHIPVDYTDQTIFCDREVSR